MAGTDPDVKDQTATASVVIDAISTKQLAELLIELAKIKIKFGATFEIIINTKKE